MLTSRDRKLPRGGASALKGHAPPYDSGEGLYVSLSIYIYVCMHVSPQGQGHR